MDVLSVYKKIKSMIFAVLCRSVKRMAGPSPRHSAWTTQKHRSGDELLLATMPDLAGLAIEPKTSRTDSDVSNHYANRFVVFT